MMSGREARVGEEDEVQTACKRGVGDPVRAVSGLKAQVSVSCGTKQTAQRSRGSNLTAAAKYLKWFPLRDLINYFLIG